VIEALPAVLALANSTKLPTPLVVSIALAAVLAFSKKVAPPLELKMAGAFEE
jgi:hypothetical protein